MQKLFICSVIILLAGFASTASRASISTSPGIMDTLTQDACRITFREHSIDIRESLTDIINVPGAVELLPGDCNPSPIIATHTKDIRLSRVTTDNTKAEE